LGFDLAPFLNSENLKGKFRQSLGVPEDMTLIGIIGRLVPIKNHIMFLKAAKILLDRNPERNLLFVVVGDGELREDLERFCRNQGLSERVRFCGWIREVSQVYADLDILALTSINEGTPVSIIEAMASSIPVVATDVGGVRDLLGRPQDSGQIDGLMLCERGILCRNKDVLGFAKGLDYLLKNRASERQMRVANARVFVRERFDQKRLLQDMESLYIELMNR